MSKQYGDSFLPASVKYGMEKWPKIPAKTDLEVLLADDPNEFHVRIPTSSMAAAALKDKTTIGFTVHETIGTGYVNPAIARTMKNTTKIEFPLQDSGWDLVATIIGNNVSIVISCGDRSFNLMSKSGVDWKIRPDDGIQVVPMETSSYGRSFAAVVAGKVMEITDPAAGMLLPSERAHVRREVPPVSWDGWEKFLIEVNATLEVSTIMNE